MVKKYSASDIVIKSIVFIIILYIYASRAGVSEMIMVLYTASATFILAISYRTIDITNMGKAWLISAAVIIIWTKRFEPDVVYYDVFYLAVIILLMIINKRSLEHNYYTIINFIKIIAIIVTMFVICEIVFKAPMKSLLSYFLSGDAYNDESHAIDIGFYVKGLASSTNSVALAGVFLFLYSLYTHNAKTRSKILLLLFSSIAIVLSGERSNYIFFPMTLVIVYLARNAKKKNRIISWLKVIFAIFMVVSIVIIATPFLENIPALRRTFRAIDMYMSGENIMSERTILNQRALEMWKEKPLFGYGWFEFYYGNSGILVANRYSHAHNLILESLSELGIIGSVFIFLPIAFSLINNYRTIKTINSSEHEEDLSLLSVTLGFQIFFILDSCLHLTFFSYRIFLYLFMVFFSNLIENRIFRY